MNWFIKPCWFANHYDILTALLGSELVSVGILHYIILWNCI